MFPMVSYMYNGENMKFSWKDGIYFALKYFQMYFENWPN